MALATVVDELSGERVGTDPVIGYLGDPWFRASLDADCPEDTRLLHVDDTDDKLDNLAAVIMHTQWPDDDECGLKGEILWYNGRARPGAGLAGFRARLKNRGIPFIWWDMEGGYSIPTDAFQVFEETADILYSTGRDGRGLPLPFAASPNLFPIGSQRAPRSALFAGRAYRTSWPNRLQWLNDAVHAADSRGWQVTIRTWQNRPDWPDEWRHLLRPSVPYESLGHHMGQYTVGLNHNLVDHDAIMCSMRLPALAMTGTPVITNEGGLTDDLALAGGAVRIAGVYGIQQAFDMLNEPAQWLAMSEAARAWAFGAHTWRHRIDTIKGRL